jgi:hypothetical protein
MQLMNLPEAASDVVKRKYFENKLKIRLILILLELQHLGVYLRHVQAKRRQEPTVCSDVLHFDLKLYELFKIFYYILLRLEANFYK